MNLDQILLIVVTAVLFILWLVETIRCRRAEALAVHLRTELSSSHELRRREHEDNILLQQSFDFAVRERNAANLRAQRAINSLRALPEIDIHCQLPADQVKTTTFNLN